MILDKKLPIEQRLGQNVAFFLNKIKADNEKDTIKDIISEMDTILTNILSKKIGFTTPDSDDFKLPFNTKIDLCASKGIIGVDLKRMLQVFDSLNKNIIEDEINSFDSNNAQELISELVKLCDNELFKMINIENKLTNDVGIKESLVYLYSIICAALVESLIEE